MPADVDRLVEAIERALAGEVLSDREVHRLDWEAAGELDRLAKEAWFELQHWARDADIRERDSEYESRKRARLEWLARELRAPQGAMSGSRSQ
jgi:hypothetical protein